MKKCISLFALVITLCGNIQSQPVQRANVYFKNNSAELTATVASLLDTIYSKLPEGKKIRIGLVGDGEDFSMTRFSDERFNSVQQYLLSKNVKPEFIRYEITASGGEAVIEKELVVSAKTILILVGFMLILYPPCICCKVVDKPVICQELQHQ